MIYIKELSPSDCKQMFPHPSIIYNSVDFNLINARKVEQLTHLVAVNTNGRPIAALIAGLRKGRYYAPFSAPFASIVTNRSHRPSVLVKAVSAIASTLRHLTITLPPPIYDTTMVNQTMLALIHSGARIDHIDWNYHIDLTIPYKPQLTAASRSTLVQSERQNYTLMHATPKRIYDVILANHNHRNHPLRMSLEQIISTTQPIGLVEADFLVLTNGTIDAAAAMIYHTSPGIAQVIYWGDTPHSPCRNPMNLLASLLTDHYTRLGFTTLDIGPASSDGIPDIGLCDFKSSIGCKCTPKVTLSVDLSL